MALHAGDTSTGNNRRGTDRGTVSAECQHLDDVDAILDAAHHHQVHIVTGVDFLQTIDRFLYRGQSRDTDVFQYLGAGCTGGTLQTIEFDEIETVLVGNLYIVVNPPGAHLDAQRHLVHGGFTKFLYLDHQVIGTEYIGVP